MQCVYVHMNKFTAERQQYFLNFNPIERKCNKTKGKNETTEFNEIVLIESHLEFESMQQFRWMSSSFVVVAVECWAILQLNQPHITNGLQTDIVYSIAVFWRLLDWTGRNWTWFEKCLKSIFMLKKVKRSSSSSSTTFVAVTVVKCVEKVENKKRQTPNRDELNEWPRFSPKAVNVNYTPTIRIITFHIIAIYSYFYEFRTKFLCHEICTPKKACLWHHAKNHCGHHNYMLFNGNWPLFTDNPIDMPTKRKSTTSSVAKNFFFYFDFSREKKEKVHFFHRNNFVATVVCADQIITNFAQVFDLQNLVYDIFIVKDCRVWDINSCGFASLRM